MGSKGVEGEGVSCGVMVRERKEGSASSIVESKGEESEASGGGVRSTVQHREHKSSRSQTKRRKDMRKDKAAANMSDGSVSDYPVMETDSQPQHHTTQPRPRHSSSDTSSHSPQASGHHRKFKLKKLASQPRSAEVRLSDLDHMQRWVSRETIDLSSPSTLGEHDLYTSRSTQESSFFKGIMSARRTDTATPHSTSQTLESGTLVMESTRVPGNSSSEGMDTRFVQGEAAMASVEVLRSYVDLLE